jgi:hypothetical protein
MDGGSRNGASLFEKAVWWASGEGSFTGNPGRYVKKGSGYGHISP